MNGAPTLRLFVAIDPPEPVRAVLAELPRLMRGVRWTPPHQYHLTLRFIGETEEARREPIERALGAISVRSFLLPVQGGGTFPPNRPPRVLWAGIGQGHPRLFQLRQRLDDALLGCGLDLDVKTFHPHFTLARCGPDAVAKDVTRLAREWAAFEGPLFRVEAFTLYRSEPGAGGTVHTPLARFPLAPA